LRRRKLPKIADLSKNNVMMLTCRVDMDINPNVLSFPLKKNHFYLNESKFIVTKN